MKPLYFSTEKRERKGKNKSQLELNHCVVVHTGHTIQKLMTRYFQLHHER